MPNVTILTPSHQLRAYLARPTANSPWPGVIVVHDAFGMTDDLRRQADWLAGAGYVVVAPDLYSWGRPIACVFATMRAMAAGRGAAFDDIDAAREWLAQQAECTGRIGVIGFCMGGGFALQMAPGHGFAVSCVNYGQSHGNLQETLRGACPIVGSFGGKDRTLPHAAAKLDQALTTLGIDHDVKEYPEAGHAFLNDHHGSGPRIMFTLLAPLMGAGYNESAAQDARQRILAFFARHLKPDT